MVEVIRDLKDQLLEQMDKDTGERGVERLDPDMVDMVKDLAEAEKCCWEAEYYRAVTEAMEGESGYGMSGNQMGGYGMSGAQGGSRGGNRGGGSRGGYGYGYGYRDSRGRFARRGYGYQEHIDALKMEMQNAEPQQREQMMRELQGLM